MRWEVLVVFTGLAGCFPTRSDELACATETDCEAGRTCEQGFCVIAPDAAPPIENEPPVDAAPVEMPDAPPDVPPRPCEGGDANAEDGSGNCYVAFKLAANRKTRANAEAACEALDMTLAIVNAADSNATVQSLIVGLDTWLGATDAVTEGTFLWPDNTPLVFANFRAGEPNNGAGTGQEDCLIIEGGKGGTWDDRNCGFTLPFVCSFSR